MPMSFEDFMAAFPIQKDQTASTVASHDTSFFIDTGDKNANRLRAALNGESWHSNVRDLVASLVTAGLTDEFIAALAPAVTLDGYTVA